MDNPLLALSHPIPFDIIDSSHIQVGLAALIDRAQDHLDQISRSEGGRTFENTMTAFDLATEDLDLAFTCIEHLESVVTTGPLREAFGEVVGSVSVFRASIPLDPDLWSAIQNYSHTAEARGLSGVKQRFLEKTLRDFVRNGANLSHEKKLRLRQIHEDLSKLTTQFSQQVVDSVAQYECRVRDEAELSGLPESALKMAAQGAKEKGYEGWLFTLQAPSVVGVLSYGENPLFRETIFRAYYGRGTRPDGHNGPVIRSILALRQEWSSLLGYADFADYVLEDRMAEKGAQARSFLQDLETHARPAFEQENKDLYAFRQEMEGKDAPPLQPWDVSFYAEKQRIAHYDFDSEVLRPYFSFSKVRTGLFDVVSELYGVRVEGCCDMPVWHPQVETYKLFDENNVLLGAFYMDLFPREGKRGGAWMNPLCSGDDDGIHLGLICCNMTPPVEGDDPLLLHTEVKTLFHEFGHLMHHLLSEVRIKSLAGANVAWDFVELPSQIMENFIWEREVLDKFAYHVDTGEPIPEDLYTKMLKARTYRSGNFIIRQIGFGAMDLSLHVDFKQGLPDDVVSAAQTMLNRYSPVDLPSGLSMVTAFHHLFGDAVGYAAGYYSYLWASVLDADAFSKFKEAGILDRDTGMAFRHTLLSKGDSAEPMALFKAFMGREPDGTALLRRSGLLTAS